MTGRDLIIYILKNGLEDEPVFKNGNFIGFVSSGEAAIALKTGLATINCLSNTGALSHIEIKNATYIPITDLQEYIKNKKIADKYAHLWNSYVGILALTVFILRIGG